MNRESFPHRNRSTNHRKSGSVIICFGYCTRTEFVSAGHPTEGNLRALSRGFHDHITSIRHRFRCPDYGVPEVGNTGQVIAP